MSLQRIALVVGAHPDDCEFGAGLTTWAWIQEGWEFHYLIATDGGRGSADAAAQRSHLVDRRRAEQERAARHLGVKSWRFLALEDGRLENDEALRQDLVRALRELRPEAVFTHSPEALDYRPFDRASGVWINHKDHRALSLAVLDAVYPCARDPHYFPDLDLPVHKTPKVYLWGCQHPDLVVESPLGLLQKIEAMALHESQFQGADWDDLARKWTAIEAFLTVCLPL
jgi:LmbE family N-acetylglucosaminyl deacetylase